MQNRILYIFIGLIIAIGGTVYAAPTIQNFTNIAPFITDTYDSGTSTQRWFHTFTKYASTTALTVSGQGTGCAQFDSLGFITTTGVACGSGGGGSGDPFAWTKETWGVSTSTTIGLLNGFLSTASTTITNALRLSSLSQGYLYTGTGGLTSTISTSTLVSNLSSGLVPYTGATANVDLGLFNLTATIVKSGEFSVYTGGGFVFFSDVGVTKLGSLYFEAASQLTIYDSTETKSAVLDVASITGAQTFTFPNTTGTFCLTSTCANFSYLFPLSATSSLLTFTGGILVNNSTSTITNLLVVNGTTTNATSTNFHISNILNFNGVAGATWASFCTSITGGAGLCDGVDATGSGGSAAVATSTNETAGRLSYWTTTSGTPALLGEVATTTLTATGVISLSQPISVIGGSASALTITGGTNGQVLGWLSGIPTWTASSSVAAGTGITITTAGAVTTVTNAGVTSLGNGTGTTCSGTAPGTCNVNTSQNIATLSNLTGNGFVKTSGGVGTLSIDTNTYATFAYPFPLAATSTMLTFSGGVLLTASSTVVGNFTITGNSTTTSATTTNSFSTTASSTNLFTQSFGGAGLADCLTTNALTYTLSTGKFSCTAQPQGTVTSVGASGVVSSTGGATPSITVTGGTNSQVLAWGNGVPVWVATTTLSAGAGITTAFSAGNWTVTNTGATFSYPFPLAATSTLLTFTGGILVNNSTSTITNLFMINSTSTNATSTNFFATTASTTNFFGAGLRGSGCSGTANKITWSGGLFSCEADEVGAGASKWTDGGTFTYLTDTADDLVVGALTVSNAPFFWDVSATTTYIGNGGAGDSFTQFGPSGYQWIMGFDDTDDSFAIASSTALGTTNALTISKSTLYTTLVGLNLTNVLAVANGGTGVATLTGCLTGNGTGAITGSGTCLTSLTGNTLAKGNFLVGNDAGLSQATSTLFISSTGNIGIASTTPFYKFSLNTGATGASIDSSGVLRLNALGTAAGAFLAVDATGQVIATTSPRYVTLVTTGTTTDAVIATMTAITGLSFSADANTRYLIDCYLMASSSVSTTGMSFAWDTPASPTRILMSGFHPTTANLVGQLSQRADDTGVGITVSVPTASVELLVVLHTLFHNGGNSGTISLGVTPETANQVGVNPGSVCQYRTY